MVEQVMEKKKIKEVILSNDPHIHTRPVLFYEDKKKIKEKNKKQFVTEFAATLTVIFADGTYVTLFADKGYEFDGATIPFGIGKGNMKLQIPALFHDVMCDDKSTINYDRNLASRIFKACLIACGVNKFVAHTMYLAVEAFQIVICDWSDPDE